jgi:WD40 repeat protein
MDATPSSKDAARDGSTSTRVRAIVAELLYRRASGEVVSDEALFAAYPELTPQLSAELRRLKQIDATRVNSGDALRSVGATISHRDSDTGKSHLDVRCPSCRAPMEVAVDTQLTDLTCGACGSHFSLVDEGQETRFRPALTKLGRFELVERIGVGGFGSVWKARDRELDRTVAIKIPRHGGMSAEDQEKFFREARAAAQLRHPSIVSVHEVGRDGDSVYIVSDFVRGVTLSDWLTGQQLTGREAAKLCAEIADALHHAHQQGVVHRDLKPANIMVDHDGQPHLMDFGLARRDAGEVTVTTDGQVLGTPAYMSPEQAEGKGHAADRRSDVYSVGVILFQMLTRELPFRGNARMLIYQVVHDPAPSPRRFNGNVRKDLETITLKCLEKDPARRYATAQDVAADLRRFLAGEPIHARPVGRTERAYRWMWRNKAVTALLSAVALTLVAGSIGSSYFAFRERDQARKATDNANSALAAKRDAESAQAAAQESARVLEWQRYLTTMQLAQLELEMGNGARAKEILGSELARGGAVEKRGFEWYYLWNRCHQALRSYPGPAETAVQAVAYSPDGSLIATGGAAVEIRETPSGQIVDTTPIENGFVSSLAFAPDGKQLVAACRNSLFLWEVSPRLKLVWRVDSDRPENLFRKASFCQKNNPLLATGCSEGTVEIRSLENGAVLNTLPAGFFAAKATYAIAFEPQKKQLAVASVEGEVALWDWDSGEKTPVGSAGAMLFALACSPKGDHIAAAGVGGVITCWDLENGRVDRFDANDSVYSLDFNLDGTLLAAGGRSLALTICDLAEGTQRKQVTDHQKMIQCVVFSPAHRTTLSTGCNDATTKVWDVASGRYRVRDPIGSDIFAVGYFSDGRKIASAHLAGQVTVYDHMAATLQHRHADVWDRERNLALDAANQRHAGFAIAAFTPHGNWAATSSGNDEVHIWDLHKGFLDPEKKTFRIDGDCIHSLRWSTDGTVLAAGAESGAVFAWFERDGWQRVQLCDGIRSTVDGGQVETLAISADGSSLTSAEIGGQISVFDLDSRQQRIAITGPEWLRAIAISHDGSRVAVGSGTYGGGPSPIQIWDTHTGKQLHALDGHSSGIKCLDFSPDGNAVVSGGYDGTLRIWDAKAGTERLTVRIDRGMVLCVQFSPDGQSIVSGSTDGTTLILNASRANLAAYEPSGHKPLSALKPK